MRKLDNMKKSVMAVLFGVLFAGAVWAAVPWTVINTAAWVKSRLYVGPAATVETTGNHVKKMLGNSATIDFASTTAGLVLSSSVTVTGAAAGDPCFVGVPTAAAALQAEFGCYVDAADSVKVWFKPTAEDVTTCTLGGQSPSTCTATVTAASTCVATPVGATAAIAAGGVALGLSGTTLTATAANAATHVVNIACRAPVNPASGTYYVRVISSQ